MNSILKKALLWFLFGSSFSAGAILVVAIYDKVESKVYEWRNMPFETKIIDYPGNVEILSTKRIDSKNYKIVGEVVNTGIDRWVILKMKATIFAGEAVVNECEGSVMDIPPSVTASFVVDCADVHGVNLPDNISHKVAVYEGVSTKYESKHNN